MTFNETAVCPVALRGSTANLLLGSPPTNDEFITCFHESWIYEFFSQNFHFHFIEGSRVSFSVMYIGIFDLNRKLLPCRKTKQRQFHEKFRRFRNRENMWWAWPKLTSNTALGAVSRSLTSIFKLAKGVPKGTFSCNDTLYSGWLNLGASSLTSRMVMVISAGQV